MALNLDLKYSYNDIAIKPAVLSLISHRSECNPYYEDNKLPLFTAPMGGVVNCDNYDVFEKNKIHAILPRTIDLDTRLKWALNGKWVAFGLSEIEDFFLKYKVSDGKNLKVLIDIANGHMAKLIDVSTKFKELYPESELMAGNIANPLTYKFYAKAKIDYVRCSIGSGSACITSSNVSVHYPIASLIDEIVSIKKSLQENGKTKLPKIVADGGVRNYSDAIKALALGADYVMIGGVFAKTVESAATTFTFFPNGSKLIINDKSAWKIEKMPNGWKLTSSELGKEMSFSVQDIFKDFYGMASKKAQQIMFGKKTHTSEGIEKALKITDTLDGWVDNFISYLQSAMSYTNAKTLQEFINNTDTIVISNNTYLSINK